VQQLVYNDPKCPDIGLLAVAVVDEPLRRHVEGRSDVQILEPLSELAWRVLVELGEAEVCYLGSAVMQENIGCFKVPMRDSHFSEIPEPLVHIEYDSCELIF
jgi:hypothetical protein